MKARISGKGAWQLDPVAFCERGGHLSDSPIGRQILRCSPQQIWEMSRYMDPLEDKLVHVDEFGWTIASPYGLSYLRREF